MCEPEAPSLPVVDDLLQKDYEQYTRILDEQFELAKKNPNVQRRRAFHVALVTTRAILGLD